MNDNSVDNFQELFKEYKKTKKELHQSLNRLDERAASINKRYEARNIFNSWRDSIAGKEWKQRQYEEQQGKCSDCSLVAYSVEYLEIDHIKPISTNPELAIDTKNLRLVCSPCNRKKGNKDK